LISFRPFSQRTRTYIKIGYSCFHPRHFWDFYGFPQSLLAKVVAVPQAGHYCFIPGIATSYGLDDRGVRFRVPIGLRIFTSRSCLERLWGPPSLLFNWYTGLFPRDKVAGTWSWQLTSN
jgi:hypothetical protein